ncbi:DUF116 domain-containing protein [Actinomycetota bacterium]
MKTAFRVIDTGSLSASENMALDEAMLEARSEDLIPDTIRFLSFKPHTVLVGQFQTVEKEIRAGYCRENGIDINRRITGGGALYWGSSDIGWEIFSAREGRFGVSRVEDYYEMFCSAVAVGLNNFGIDASFRPRNDIEVGGRKISGSGGTSSGDAFLFQGSLLVDLDIDLMLRSLRVPVEKLNYSEIDSLRDRITWLSREAGYLPSRDEIINGLLRGFVDVLGIEIYRGELTKKEKDLTASKLKYFNSRKHVYKIKDKKSQYYLKSITKSHKSVIKCSANIDIKRGMLKNLYFTGDFFIYPKRAIFDLESRLKNISIKDGCTAGIIEDFFKEYPQPISGVIPEELIRVLESCIAKTELKKYDIPLKYFNDIYLVHSDFYDKNKIDFLLLPYCAKLPECEFRYSQGCTFCGKCSIGDAIKLSEKYGIEHMSIVSYEHLHQTLLDLKKKGVRYYAGCCCEAFYNKHKQDFEKVDLPGILLNIDSTTCYDLGKEEDAYLGKFEGFTNIKLSLMEKIFKVMS